MITANAILCSACIVAGALLIGGLLLLAIAWLNDRWQRRGKVDPQAK